MAKTTLSKNEIKESIHAFVRKEREKGVSFNEIKEMLADSPWPQSTIRSVFKKEQSHDDQYQIEQLRALQEKLLKQKQKKLHNKYANKYKHFYSHTLSHLKDIEKKYDQQKITENKEMLDKMATSLQQKIEKVSSSADNEDVQKQIQKAIDKEMSIEIERMHDRERAREQMRRAYDSEDEESRPAIKSSNTKQSADQEEIHEEEAPMHPIKRRPKNRGQSSRIHFDDDGATVSGPVQVNASEITFKGPMPGSASMSSKDLDTLESRFKRAASSSSFDEAYRNPIMPDKLNLVQGPVGDRAQTGIKGLDPVIQGGLKRQTTTMIAGGPGTGKTTLGLQYIYNGAVKFNEPGIFISFEMTQQHIVEMGKMFSWDIQSQIDKNMIAVREFTPEQLDKMLKTGGGSLRDLVESMNATRIVIDSVTAFMLLYEGEIAQRRACLELFHNLEKWNCTVLVVAEEDHHAHNHEASVLEYETDAVVVVYNERRGDLRQRSLEIFKMRGTNHAGRVFPMRLTSDGLVVYPQQSF